MIFHSVIFGKILNAADEKARQEIGDEIPYHDFPPRDFSTQ